MSVNSQLLRKIPKVDELLREGRATEDPAKRRIGP